jgi:hypothetical protein
MPSDAPVRRPRSILRNAKPTRRGFDGGVDPRIGVKTFALIANRFVACGLRELSVGDGGAYGARNPTKHDWLSWGREPG